VRYSKAALLLFGAGLVLGLVVVVGEIRWLQRLASAVMALGLIALPAALVADSRRKLARVRPPIRSQRQRAQRPPRPRARSRKPAAQRR